MDGPIASMSQHIFRAQNGTRAAPVPFDIRREAQFRAGVSAAQFTATDIHDECQDRNRMRGKQGQRPKPIGGVDA